MIRVNDLKSHYSIKILVALVLVKLGTAGAVSAMTANFVEPIVKELGCAWTIIFISIEFSYY